MPTCDIEDFNLIILSSDNIVVFQTDDASVGWNGVYDGEMQAGDFTYEISGKMNGEIFSFEGTVSILDNSLDSINCDNCYFATQLDGVQLNNTLPSSETGCD